MGLIPQVEYHSLVTEKETNMNFQVNRKSIDKQKDIVNAVIRQDILKV